MSIELEKEKLEMKKKKLLLQERLIKEKEKQAQARRLIEIGKIAAKSKIDHLDDETLLGAFLEIAAKHSEPAAQKSWKEIVKAFLESSETDSQEPLIISFASDPGPEVKSLLKGCGFKWNNFRKEFYGYGNRMSVEKSLSSTDYRLEVTE